MKQTFVFTENADRKTILRSGAVPSQNLPVRLFDKAQPSADQREERKQKRESLAAAQAEESEWVQALFSSYLEETMTLRTSENEAPVSHEEPDTAECPPAGNLILQTGVNLLMLCTI